MSQITSASFSSSASFGLEIQKIRHQAFNIFKDQLTRTQDRHRNSVAPVNGGEALSISTNQSHGNCDSKLKSMTTMAMAVMAISIAMKIKHGNSGTETLSDLPVLLVRIEMALLPPPSEAALLESSCKGTQVNRTKKK